jgi:hypothetical protein
VEISRDGRYLFTVNTGSGNISSYAISTGGSLSLIGSTPIRGGGADIDLRLSPDGKTLSVDGSGNHILSVFCRPAAHPPGSPASRHIQPLFLARPATWAGQGDGQARCAWR